MMKRGRRYLILAIVLAVALTAVMGTLWARSVRDPAAAILRQAETDDGKVTPLTESQMLALCHISMSEARKISYRTRVLELTGGRFGIFAPHCTTERIVHLGKDAAVPALIALAEDTKQQAGDRLWAYKMLLYFNDVRSFHAWMRVAESTPQLRVYFYKLLPVSVDSPYHRPEGLALIKKEMEGRTYEEFLLHLLDSLVKDKDLQPDDWGILRWLNRYYGYDFDDQFARSQPSVTAFRNAELRKGYEPLFAYEYIFRQYKYGSEEYPAPKDVYGKGLTEVFANPADREACRKLFELYNEPRQYPGRFDRLDDWQARLIAWYTAARPFLKYDPELDRFVPRDASGAIIAIPTPEPQPVPEEELEPMPADEKEKVKSVQYYD